MIIKKNTLCVCLLIIVSENKFLYTNRMYWIYKLLTLVWVELLKRYQNSQ